MKDAFSLWLNEHAEIGLQLAELAISNAGRRLKAGKKVERRRSPRAGAARQTGRLRRTGTDARGTVPGRGRLRRRLGEAGAGQGIPGDHAAALKILNTWEVDGGEVLASQEVHDIAVAIGVDPGASDLAQLRYGKICILADADSDGLHIATLLCALFVRHFRPLVEAGHVCVAMPPLYRIDLGKDIYYALDEAERDGILERLAAEKKRGKPQVTRFRGLGEMNPLQLRETTMDPNTRRLVQLTLEDATGTLEIMDMLLARSAPVTASPGWKARATWPRCWSDAPPAGHPRPVRGPGPGGRGAARATGSGSLELHLRTCGGGHARRQPLRAGLVWWRAVDGFRPRR